MKSILIAIPPDRCEKIANGKKTIEVRKTRPKIDTPFKCYIYCTLPKRPYSDYFVINSELMVGGGRVIGEFMCDKINETGLDSFGIYEIVSEIPNERINIVNESCLSFDEYVKYSNLKPCYAWHISDLVIYDTPKELGEFIKPCPFGDCLMCKYHDNGTYWEPPCCNYEDWEEIKRPPQSWCYVESEMIENG